MFTPNRTRELEWTGCVFVEINFLERESTCFGVMRHLHQECQLCTKESQVMVVKNLVLKKVKKSSFWRQNL